MIIYWFMYLFPAGITMIYVSRYPKYSNLLWLGIGLLFVVLIGFRHEVGGDWYHYVHHYKRVIGVSLDAALVRGDPGYIFLNWIMASWGWGMYGVNVIAAFIFIAGLTIFCRQQPIPWLAFSVAVPYLLVVVAMGYTRQAVAIGLFLWAITFLERGNLKYYIVFVVIAALFHKTAVLMIPLGIFLHGKGFLLRVMAVGGVAYGLWDLLLAEHQDELWRNYVDVQMQSEGARVRVLMNLVPSLFLLFYWRRWRESFPNFWFWFWICIGSILSVALVGVASTAVDRVALYFIPIQMVVFSRLPYLAAKSISSNLIIFGILTGYAVVLFVWLNYASHAKYWLPYKNVLFL